MHSAVPVPWFGRPDVTCSAAAAAHPGGLRQNRQSGTRPDRNFLVVYVKTARHRGRRAGPGSCRNLLGGGDIAMNIGRGATQQPGVLSTVVDMLFSRGKTQLIDADSALRGREEPIPVPETHAVNGNRIVAPFPGTLQTAVFGLAASGAPNRSSGKRRGFTPPRSGTRAASRRTRRTRRSVRPGPGTPRRSWSSSTPR